jgi:putative DNA primase/helicase
MKNETPNPRHPCFINSKTGLFRVAPKTGEKVRIGNFFRPIAYVTRESDDRQYLLVKIHDRMGSVKNLFILMGDITTKNKAVISELSNAGYDCKGDRQHVAWIFEYLEIHKPTEHRIVTTKTGWRDKIFVLPGAPIHSEGKTYWFQPNDSGHVPFNPSGTLDDWKAHVARPAMMSSRLVLAISYALAAPLRRFTNIDSGGFHIHGDSSQGKTTQIIVGQSVNYYLPRTDLYTWDMTATGGEEIASEHNDRLLCLDELARIPASNDAERAQKARHLTFLFGTGRGRTRSRRYGATVMASSSIRQTGSSSVLILSTGEKALSELASNAGINRLRGEEVRLIDLPAASDGSIGIYDSLPDNWLQDKKKSALIAAQHSEKLEAHCARYHGTALLAYVTYLSGHYDGMQTRVEKLMQKFESKVKPTSGLQKRFLRRFSLAYAAGIIAITAQILPWKKKDLRDSILKCYRDAWATQPDPERDAKQAMAALRKELGACHRVKKDQPLSQSAWENASGFRMSSKSGETDYLLKPATLNKICNSPMVRGLVLEDLRKKGWLKPDTAHAGCSTRQVRLPGIQGRSRYYVISANFKNDQ